MCGMFWATLVILLGALASARAASRNPVLLVSMNGLRADIIDNFIVRYPNSSMSRIVSSGVKADYMIPAFPTVTFPNHWTLVTGLYPESHGIIGDPQYDSVYDEFWSKSDDNGRDLKWWNLTDPIWLTAKRSVSTFFMRKFF